jgi:hypothetical protein
VNGYQWDAKADNDTQFALEFKLISQGNEESNATAEYRRESKSRYVPFKPEFGQRGLNIAGIHTYERSR